MDHNHKTVFESDFMDVLIAAQEESNRLGLNKVYDIILLKSLIYFPKSNLKDFFQYAGLNWNSVNTALQTQINLYIEENNIKKEEEDSQDEEDKSSDKEKNVEDSENGSKEESKGKKSERFKNTAIDWQLITNFINLSSESEETISNSCYYSYDVKRIGEVEYILALLEENYNTYVEGFFRLINIDTRLVTRYFEGVMADNNMEIESDDDDLDEDEFNDIPTQEVQPDFETPKNGNEESKVFIPYSVQSYLDFVRVDITKESPIRGRENETLAVMKVLLKSKKSNAVLVGQPGVGKTAIVEHLTWLIDKGKCPDGLKGKCVLSLDVNALIAGTKYVGMAEQRFTELLRFLKSQKNVILFIDEIHTIVGAGCSEDNTLDLANALKPILARGETIVIGATTEHEYENWMSKDKALKRRFEKIEIREPEYAEVHSMIKQQVENLQEFHQVKIGSKALDYIIKVSGCFNTETANPDRTLDMVDKAMVNAKLNNKKTVTIGIVMNNFAANFKLYRKMNDEIKYQTAFHELGHYLVRRYSKYLQVEKTLAISIIPTEDYLGVTVSDAANHDVINWSYNAHLENIAIHLAGRVAEKMYSDDYSSGASSDLKKATDEAKKMITEYGMTSQFSERNIEIDRSEKQTEDLNKEIDRIIQEGYALATKILHEHKNTLTELAEILCCKGIIVGNDLENISRQVEMKNGK